MKNIFLRYLASNMIKKISKDFVGNLLIIFPNKETLTLGNKHNAIKIRIYSYNFFLRLYIFGIPSAGFSYSKGEWGTSNLEKLLELFFKNIYLIQSLSKIHKVNLYNRLKKYYAFNSIKRSQKQINFHYDIGNIFYEKWLDKTMTYSSAIFNSKHDTLEQAQINKYKNIVNILNIKKSDILLEIGCGWGGFINYIQKNIGATITGITISKEQYHFTKNFTFKKNKVFFMDYRKINQTYDKIISIEMFEAVGKKNWNNYFKILEQSLNNKGIALLQIITIDEKKYLAYENSSDFIQQYIFPGGMLPTKNHLKNIAKKNQLEIEEKISFRNDYAKTLHLWREKFFNKWKDIEKLGFDDKFKRLWEYYLCYCEIGFKNGSIDVSQFLISKKQNG